MRVYFDYNATTPLAPEVIDAVARASRDTFGNASSVHHFGQQAKAAMDDARSELATLIHGDPSEIVFTSGGTEADNLAIRGAAEAIEPTGRRHLIASAIEHEAVLNTLKALARRGWRTTLLPVDDSGIVAPDRLREALADDTALVSIMHANNEIGTIQPIAELARWRTRAAPCCTPTPCNRSARFRWTCARSASTCCRCRRTSSTDRRAPARSGSSAARACCRSSPVANTSATAARAPKTCRRLSDSASRRGWRAGSSAPKRRESRALRDRLEEGILRGVPGTAVNGARGSRVPNTSNISFDRVEAESLLIALDLEGIAVSTGSACSSGTLEPSHVLRAMGLPTHRTQNSLRFSLGMFSTEAEVDRVVEVLPRLVEKLRGLTRTGLGTRDSGLGFPGSRSPKPESSYFVSAIS